MLDNFETETIPHYRVNADMRTEEFIGEPVYVGEVIPRVWDEKINTAVNFFSTYLHFCMNAQQQKTGRVEVRAIEVTWI